MGVAAVLSFYGWATIRRAVVGVERLVVIEHVWIATGSVAAIVWLADAPVARSLDVFAVGLGVFLAFGRIGCFQVGCCHGTPAHTGVRYGPGFGLTPRLAAQRLVPVQLLESVALAGITLVALVLCGQRPGTALVWFAAALAVLRFTTESLRGDERPLVVGISIARVLCLAQAVAALALAEAWLVAGSPTRTSVVGAGATVVVLIAGVVLAGRRQPPFTNSLEVDRTWVTAAALADVECADPLVDETPAQVRVAVSHSDQALHVSLSHPDCDVSHLARLFVPDQLLLRHGVAHLQFRRGNPCAPGTTRVADRHSTSVDSYFDDPQADGMNGTGDERPNILLPR
ncbi:MAG: prolipoprotein diacylglyceryl transferase family protein [Actinomycetota bacterium]